MNIKTLGVVGAGQMGQGIAQAFASVGYKVILTDISNAALSRGLNAIRASLERLDGKGQLAATPAAVLARIHSSSELSALGDAELVVEAVSENLALKTRLFGELDQLCPPATILASNTSSIAITRLAAATARPQRVIGMHFMNPVAVMPLVEVIRGLQTDDACVAAVEALIRRIDKVAVASRDRPGFIVNRLLLPMINEAIFALYEGVAEAAEIDAAMRLGANHPLGPLALADLIGLDTCLSIMEVLYQGFHDPKYRPCPLLVQMVDAGYLGRKSRRGFFHYS